MNVKGVLLINLGTPDNFNPPAVKRYLREFLNDTRVVDISAAFRWLLVNLIIIPSRYKKSALAYEKIWQAGDSPLRINMQKLTLALSQQLGENYQVEFGMRYGNPSIKTALEKLSACNSIVVLPLFPQYTSAASGSAIEKVLSLLQSKWNMPALNILRDFYQDTGFINAYAQVIRDSLANQSVDMVLFSYHGLPERQINKSGCRSVCDRVHACPEISNANDYCYRAQCFATTRKIVDLLGLTSEKYAVAFQSRLGRTPWIKPYTDLLLAEFINKGIKNLAIVCPSFTADCLETLEEVNIRAREQWQALGGQHFTFIPCLNDSPPWVNALQKMIEQPVVPHA